MKEIKIRCDVKDTLDWRLITPLQGDYKVTTPVKLDKLCRVIIKRGIRFPSFISKVGREYLAIDTHRRLEAYAKLEAEGYSIPVVPVVYIHAKNKSEAKQLLLECDSRYGTPTQDGFTDFIADLDLDFLADIEIPDIDIDFDTDETDGNDEVPELQEKAVSQLGEIYELGNSLLMCGDSTDPETIRRLMGTDKADMVLTDPPYNMQMGRGGCFEGTVSGMRDRVKDIINFDVNILKFVPSMGINNVFIFTSKSGIKDYLNMFDGYKYDIHVWAKSNPTPLAGNHFLPDIEYLLYFHKTGRVFNGGLKPTEIYKRYYVSSKLEGRNNVGDLHPTMKPVELLSNKIQICSKQGGIVLDLFGGSGSVLIAAEKNNRKCRMVELDAHYVDVIIKR